MMRPESTLSESKEQHTPRKPMHEPTSQLPGTGPQLEPLLRHGSCGLQSSWVIRHGSWRALAQVLALATFSAAAADSLLPNGGFEQADPRNRAKPAFWDPVDGLGVQWVAAGEHGQAIRLDTAISEIKMVEQWKRTGLDKYAFPKPAASAIAETYGLSYYSDAIPVRKGQPYRITYDYKGASGGAKMWVRGWGMFQGEKRRRWETTIECRVKHPTQWTTITQEFFPTKVRPEVTEIRVMLFAFYPAGVYWFDNVKIEPIPLEEYEADRKKTAPAAW